MVCTIAVVVVVAGCGGNATPAAPLSTAPSPPTQDAATSVAPVGSPAAMDGLVSVDESARASEVLQANDIASELLGRYGGQLTPWEPAELEGEPRGAVAMIEFSEPISMNPTVLRHDQAVGEPTRVEDYVLVTVQLGDEVVERFGVVVDLVTMTIVHLAPTSAPPGTTLPVPG